jgi:hypothetical protein
MRPPEHKSGEIQSTEAGGRGYYDSVGKRKALNLPRCELGLLYQLHDRQPAFPQEPSHHAPCHNESLVGEVGEIFSAMP